MKINKISITIVIISMSVVAMAQQDPMYTQYMFNLSSVNAAAIGRGDNISFMNVDRFQWVGFEGAPKTYSVTADIPVKFFNSGFGFTYINDNIGPETTNNFYIDYAYHIQVARGIRLGMGLKAGFKVYSADFSDIGQDGVDDEEFASNINGDFMPNFGLGIFLYGQNYYFGLSSPKLVNHKYQNTSNISGGEERHYFIIGGYVLPINDNAVFKPSAAVKFVKGAPASYDISANFYLYNCFWAGLAYRSGDALSFLTQIEVTERFSIGYAYDMTLSKIRKTSSGSHEIMLRFDLKSFKDKIRSPRYF
jgi:type IX secretion system PorP/SprF family membrane protein